MKKKENSRGTDENYSSNWKYFSALKFLVPSLSATPIMENLVRKLALNFFNCSSQLYICSLLVLFLVLKYMPIIVLPFENIAY